jgi:hypothetical protein
MSGYEPRGNHCIDSIVETNLWDDRATSQFSHPFISLNIVFDARDEVIRMWVSCVDVI